MKTWLRTGLVLSLGVCGFGTPGRGQVVERERDVTITGPRGRSIERSIRSERGPGFVERQVNVQRPGGSYHSEAFAARGVRAPGPGPMRGGPVPSAFWGGPGWGPPVVVNRGMPVGEALAIGGGLFGLGLFAGSALSAPPPPPVVVAPAPPPVVIYNPPQPYSPPPPPQATVIVDPVADAIGRLRSYHDHSRRDGAYTLGRLRDPRGVDPLVERLRDDWSKEVRVACATALGQIGDPRAAVALETAQISDNKQAVRDAASLALGRLQYPASANATARSSTVTRMPNEPALSNVPPPPIPAPPAEAGFQDRP